MFNLFSSRSDIHFRRMAELLREAQINRVEHQAAAEHHTALARMYSDRVERLETELGEALRGGLSGASILLDGNERPADAEIVSPAQPARRRLSSL